MGCVLTLWPRHASSRGVHRQEEDSDEVSPDMYTGVCVCEVLIAQRKTAARCLLIHMHTGRSPLQHLRDRPTQQLVAKLFDSLVETRNRCHIQSRVVLRYTSRARAVENCPKKKQQKIAAEIGFDPCRVYKDSSPQQLIAFLAVSPETKIAL